MLFLRLSQSTHHSGRRMLRCSTDLAMVAADPQCQCGHGRNVGLGYRRVAKMSSCVDTPLNTDIPDRSLSIAAYQPSYEARQTWTKEVAVLAIFQEG